MKKDDLYSTQVSAEEAAQVPKEETVQTPERPDTPKANEIPKAENQMIQEEEIPVESDTDDDLPTDADQLRSQKPPLVPQRPATRTPTATVWKELGPLQSNDNQKKKKKNSSTAAPPNVDLISKVFQK